MVWYLQELDDAVKQVAHVLSDFEKFHEGAECVVYRYNPASIRVKIVHPVFKGKSRGERHDYAMQYLHALPDDVLSQISILLCLPPGEASLMELEFDDPSRSKL